VKIESSNEPSLPPRYYHQYWHLAIEQSEREEIDCHPTTSRALQKPSKRTCSGVSIVGEKDMSDTGTAQIFAAEVGV
jgi:hypothetical protein